MTRGVSGGSRFLFDGFDAAQARIEANERVAEERWAALDFRLVQIDAALDGLESWMALEAPFDARAEAWADPGLDCDAGPALSV